MSFEEPIDDLTEADADTERRLGAFPNPSTDMCPVVPLGFDGGRVIFAMPEGEIRSELASKIAGMLRTDIFACSAGQAFLTNWRDSDDKFQRDLATVWFVRKCREAGKWDTRRVMRSLGVWPGGPGETVLHRGVEVQRWTADGKVERQSVVDALRSLTGPLYRLHPPAPMPAKPCAVSDGAWVRAHLDSWRFETLGDDGLSGADVLVGFFGLALLGAVAPFRAHVLLAALPGAGKTTLLTFAHALLSALSGEVINSFTDAGFRLEISGMARPVIVDEAESAAGDMGPGPVEQVLNYLRLMATGQGANRKMGDTGNGQSAQTAVGAVLMAAVLPPRLDSALATRVAEVRMLPIGPEKENAPPGPRLNDAQLAAAVDRARTLAPALLGRALKGATRYREDMMAVKAALMEAGDSARTADLVAALAAGRRLLMADEPLGLAEAAEEAGFWRPLLAERERSDVVNNPGADALGHLMNADSGLQLGGRRATLGELILRTVSAGESDYDDVLNVHGLRIWREFGPDGREGPWLLVANQHSALDRIFGKTQWKDHRKALAYLDALGPQHVTWAARPLHFGLGVKSRSLAVPLAPWLDKTVRVPPSVPATVPGDDHVF